MRIGQHLGELDDFISSRHGATTTSHNKRPIRRGRGRRRLDTLTHGDDGGLPQHGDKQLHRTIILGRGGESLGQVGEAGREDVVEPAVLDGPVLALEPAVGRLGAGLLAVEQAFPEHVGEDDAFDQHGVGLEAALGDFLVEEFAYSWLASLEFDLGYGKSSIDLYIYRYIG